MHKRYAKSQWKTTLNSSRPYPQICFSYFPGRDPCSTAKQLMFSDLLCHKQLINTALLLSTVGLLPSQGGCHEMSLSKRAPGRYRQAGRDESFRKRAWMNYDS